MKIEYVKLNVGDTAGIAQMSVLARQIVKEHYDPIIGSEQNDYMIDMFQSEAGIAQQLERGDEMFFVNQDNTHIGYFAFYRRGNELYLNKLYLKKEYRGLGLSKSIIKFIAERAAAMNLGSITLNVNKHNGSIEIYRRLGFKIIRSEKNSIGHGYFMDDYVMELNV